MGGVITIVNRLYKLLGDVKKMGCDRCNHLGYIVMEDGANKICSCKLAEKIKSALHNHPNVLLAKNMKFNLELFPENTVVSVPNIDKINSVIKAVFTYLYLKGRVHQLDMIDSHTLIDAYFDKNIYYTISGIKESDFPVFLIEKDKQNKLLPEILQNIASYRANILGKPTWIVYIDSDKKIEQISTYSSLIKSLNDYKFTFRSVK